MTESSNTYTEPAQHGHLQAGFGNAVELDIVHTPSRVKGVGGTIAIKPFVHTPISAGTVWPDSGLVTPVYWARLADELGKDNMVVKSAAPIFEERSQNGKMVIRQDAAITVSLTPTAEPKGVFDRIKQAVKHVSGIQPSDLKGYKPEISLGNAASI